MCGRVPQPLTTITDNNDIVSAMCNETECTKFVEEISGKKKRKLLQMEEGQV